jgi:hypothetical protein
VVGYSDDWNDAAQNVGYPGNSMSTGRTKRTRLDHILSSENAAQVAPQAARVWDVRDLNTSCTQVTVTLGDPPACDASCSCTYIDDSGVRPSDHIPLTVRYKFVQ